MSTDGLVEKIAELRERAKRMREGAEYASGNAYYDGMRRVQALQARIANLERVAAEPKDRRKREIQQIHILRRQRGMDDDTYRAMLWTQARVESTTELDELQRRRILDFLKATAPTRPGWVSPRVKMPEHKTRMAKKICAILGNNGLTHGYADGIAKQMQHVDRWEFLHADDLHKLIAALEYEFGAKPRKRKKMSEQERNSVHSDSLGDGERGCK